MMIERHVISGNNVNLMLEAPCGANRPLRFNRRMESGQALVELALMLPFLVLLLLGSVEMGRYAYLAILVGNAARAGTAYGVQSIPQSVDTIGITTAARNDFKNNGQVSTNLSVSSSVVCGCDSAGTVTSQVCVGTGAGTCPAGAHWVVVLSVTASGSFPSIFSYPLIPSPIALSRTSSMRVRLV
jgi:Flp pilus assembly protein TadG